MFFYIISSIFVFLSSLIVTFAEKDKCFSKFLFYFTFVYLFFFSAVRYGIGTDYPHYEYYYKAIGQGNLIYKKSEPLFYYLNLLFNNLKLDYKFFIATCSFLTIFIFYKSSSIKTFFYDVNFFYTLIYIQSFCLIRQMLACVISIYALRKYKDCFLKCVLLLIAASFFHKTFWLIVFLYLFSKIIHKILPYRLSAFIIILFFFLFFYTPFLEIIVTNFAALLGLSSFSGYLSFSRHLGGVMFLRYVYLFLFLLLFYRVNNKNSLVFLLLLFMFFSEFAGTQILILASRLPQTCYCLFFLIINENNVSIINKKIFNLKNKNSFIIIIIIFLLYFILFVQLTTGFKLNNVVPYRWIL